MEDVLDLYAESYQEALPVVCVDERPVQLLGDLVEFLPMKSGQAKRYDYEYERKGTANLFILCQPLAGWREVKVTSQRKKVDFAELLRDLVDKHFPQAERIRVVLDNLNTHNPSALYEAFSPTEARGILRKLEFHYTPKHGSWLNMAEIEISILSRQCLKQRIPSLESLRNLVTLWTVERNRQAARINWTFDLTNARTTLARLYPSLETNVVEH